MKNIASPRKNFERTSASAWRLFWPSLLVPAPPPKLNVVAKRPKGNGANPKETCTPLPPPMTPPPPPPPSAFLPKKLENAEKGDSYNWNDRIFTFGSQNNAWDSWSRGRITHSLWLGLCSYSLRSWRHLIARISFMIGPPSIQGDNLTGKKVIYCKIIGKSILTRKITNQ